MKTSIIVSLCMMLAAGLAGTDTAAAAKKKFRDRSEISKEERARIFKWATEQCRKKYGPRIHHVEIEYRYGRYICYYGG